eukprot:gnl/TRDRNA2_/TRDRNA2_94908_c0_seq1.p1 gnl/TRDRNA2_/TRDRNA2_94908_c0~~gnl/TRDRNA2_/TRDRNA2_94908_c0_seq1.p1  ORF type:complete len:369 (+),score=33.42 gnl/TRDRNA2_/TRDRNA2_94908_c0_seq1:53-1108(+)
MACEDSPEYIELDPANAARAPSPRWRTWAGLCCTALTAGAVVLWQVGAAGQQHLRAEGLVTRLTAASPSQHLDLEDTTLGMIGQVALPARGSVRLGKQSHLSLVDSANLRAARRPEVSWPDRRHHVLGRRHKAPLSVVHATPMDFVLWYNNMCLVNPLPTKMATVCICHILGDFGAQTIGGANITTFDLGRGLRSGVAGLIVKGPLLHFWYQFLYEYVSFGGAWWAVIPKLALDMGPMQLIKNTLYAFMIGVLAQRDPREVWKDVKKTAVPGMVAAFKFYPIPNILQFTLVPIQLQVLWKATFQMCWIVILSWINNEGLRKQKLEEARLAALNATDSGEDASGGTIQPKPA